MANSLRITELDFDSIKQNLKTFLQNQSEFTDYDFEGSGLAVLLDILAYNTHYNAFYANMAINEMFIDSAVKRESVVSISKLLNYVPRSARAAAARINVTVDGVSGAPGSLSIDRFTAFNSSINDSTYTFYNIEPATITPIGGVYSYEGLDVYEGTYVVNKFTVGSTPGPAEKFVIPNTNIDTTTIRVTVQDTITSTTSTTYTEFDGDITQVTEDTTIFYLEQNINNQYQIYFGDGVIGKQLSVGNRVTIEYLATSAEDANISEKIDQSFSISGSISGGTYSGVTIETVSQSTSGQAAETVDEIRFNAPKAAAAQNRLVSKYDYEIFLKRNYSYIDAISVWGGEDNDPPQYGKVFISVLPKTSQFLTTSRKNKIIEDIKKKRVMAITPSFVDPDVYYIHVTSAVRYNPNTTNETATDISNAVTAAIASYFSSNLGSFGEDFSLSKLQTAIDDARASISGNTTEIIVSKEFEVELGVGISEKVKINNKIEEHSISSAKFYYDSLGVIYPAKIRDLPDQATVELSGTYRRTGSIITCTFDENHELTVGESVTLTFSGSSESGLYEVNEIIDDEKFTVISAASGNDSGTVDIQSEARGRLQIYNPDDNTILNNNIGFVSYNSGLIQINTITVAGYIEDDGQHLHVDFYFKLTKDSQDLSVARNQIIRRSTATNSSITDRLAGTSISIQAIPR
jgi:hypothetical protein